MSLTESEVSSLTQLGLSGDSHDRAARILTMLRDAPTGELHEDELSPALDGQLQPAIAYLKQAGLIDGYRIGGDVYYRLQTSQAGAAKEAAMV